MRQIENTIKNRGMHKVQEERLGAMRQMACRMAHDINNSLTPIMGYADFILDTQHKLSSDELRKYVTCIRAAAGDMAFWVEQVRQFYRSRERHEALQFVALQGVVRDVLDSVQPRCQDFVASKGGVIAIETDWVEPLPALWANPGELREGIRQLVLNAVEAMPEGGALRVSIQSDDAQVILAVKDTGIGMDETTRQHCLEPFFSTKLTRGSGLGLALVYGFMQRHNGNIEVDSQLGVGTTIRLTFYTAEGPGKSAGADID